MIAGLLDGGTLLLLRCERFTDNDSHDAGCKGAFRGRASRDFSFFRVDMYMRMCVHGYTRIHIYEYVDMLHV